MADKLSVIRDEVAAVKQVIQMDFCENAGSFSQSSTKMPSLVLPSHLNTVLQAA
jgi:hypothetical protein